MDPVHEFPVVPHCCPHCGAEVDGALSARETKAPRDGDVLLCGECGELSRYGSDGGAEPLTAAEALIWLQDPELVAMQRWIRGARRQGVPQ
jgi:hypothetical protein